MADSSVMRRMFTPQHGYTQKDPKLQMLFNTAWEMAYQQVVEVVKGAQEVDMLPRDHPACEYRDVWENLSVIDELPEPLLVEDHNRLVIQGGAWKEILQILHLPHIGVSKMRETARSMYYWPRMSQHMKQMCEACGECREMGPSRPREPTIPAMEHPFRSQSP